MSMPNHNAYSQQPPMPWWITAIVAGAVALLIIITLIQGRRIRRKLRGNSD